MVSENGTQKTLEQNKDFEVSESKLDKLERIQVHHQRINSKMKETIQRPCNNVTITQLSRRHPSLQWIRLRLSPTSDGNIEIRSPDDNMALDKVEYVDDELEQTFDADEVSASGFSGTGVDSSNTSEYYHSKSYDKANNKINKSQA